MKTIDKVFAKEFKEMMNTRRAQVGVFDLRTLPVPAIKSLHRGSSDGQVMAKALGIKEPFFEKLNGEVIHIEKNDAIEKRQVLSDGSFRKDEQGRFVTRPVKVRTGFVLVSSSVNIGLRNKISVNGVDRVHKPAEGYSYIDYKECQGERVYYYTIPEDCAQPLNQYALIVTPNKHRVYYKGSRLALQNGHHVYIYVIPYSARRAKGYRLIGVKPSRNFDKEVTHLLGFWQRQGVLFDLRMTALEEQVGGRVNLGIEDLVSGVKEER